MKTVFLLGGQDLEMFTIKQLLESNNICYFDKELSWGAKLSAYQNIINNAQKYKKIYGIELTRDVAVPNNYIEIDHHGENDYKDSSLEQVAKILGIELSREQKIIAANDSRYIVGMQAIGASEKEIINIRHRERKILGVTKEDEKEAQNIVQKSVSNSIYTQMNSFVALSDFAYLKYTQYLIYNDSSILFYFYKKEQILSFLQEHNIMTNAIYYGGGEYGFVGIKANILSCDAIQNLVKEFQ